MSWLTFIRKVDGRSTDGRLLSLWRCVCGNTKVLPTCRVRSGVVVSCGCFKPKNIVHGMKGTTTYSSWCAMKSRCCDPGSKDYVRWGAKGIRVCDRWMRFELFLEDMGVRPPGTSLDRYPNRHGNYEPGNCRWATSVQQQENKDNFTVLITPVGVMPLRDYAPIVGITTGAAHMRLKRGKLEGCKKWVA